MSVQGLCSVYASETTRQHFLAQFVFRVCLGGISNFKLEGNGSSKVAAGATNQNCSLACKWHPSMEATIFKAEFCSEQGGGSNFSETPRRRYPECSPDLSDSCWIDTDISDRCQNKIHIYRLGIQTPRSRILLKCRDMYSGLMDESCSMCYEHACPKAARIGGEDEWNSLDCLSTRQCSRRVYAESTLCSTLCSTLWSTLTLCDTWKNGGQDTNRSLWGEEQIGITWRCQWVDTLEFDFRVVSLEILLAGWCAPKQPF